MGTPESVSTFFFLSKLLPAFVLPLGVTLVAVLLGLWLRRRWLIGAGLVILWLSSLPFVGEFLGRAVEGGAERLPASAAPNADAIVVLSAGRRTAPGAAAISEWGDPNRFFAGVELFKAGKAPILVFTGAGTPGDPDTTLEGDILAQYATDLGIPPDHIVTTGLVLNTADEADAVTTALRQRPPPRAAEILLVTSAFHMPRASLLFERTGVRVTPFPVDFVPVRIGIGLLDFVPSPAALWQSQRAIRELYGRLFYRFLVR